MFYQSQLPPVYTVQGPIIQGPPIHGTPVHFNQFQDEYLPQQYVVEQPSGVAEKEKTRSCHRFTPYRWFLYILTLIFLVIAFGLLIAVICRANTENRSQQIFNSHKSVLASVYNNQRKLPILELSLHEKACPNDTQRIDLYNFPAPEVAIYPPLDVNLTYTSIIDGRYICALRDNTYVIRSVCPKTASNRVGLKGCSQFTQAPISRVSLVAGADGRYSLGVERNTQNQPVVDLELIQNGRPCADPRLAPARNGNVVPKNIAVKFTGCGGVDNEKTHYNEVHNFQISSNKYLGEVQKLNASYNVSSWYPGLENQAENETLRLYAESRVDVPLTAACENFHVTLNNLYTSNTADALVDYLYNVKVFAAVALTFTCLGLLLWVVFVLLRRKFRKLYLIVYVLAAIVAVILVILGIWYFSYKTNNVGFNDQVELRRIRDANCLDNFGAAYKHSVNELLRSQRWYNYVCRLVVALFVIGIIYLVILAIGLIIARKY